MTLGCLACQCWMKENEKGGGGVEKFKQFWDTKWKDAKDRLFPHDHHDDEKDAFELLLELYAHHEIVIGEIYELTESALGIFEFYIPQFCTFLLHGEPRNRSQLECFLLSRCSQSLQFAHRLHWFLEAFCDDGKGYESEGLSAALPVTSTQQAPFQVSLLAVIEVQGGIPADMMDQKFAANENRTEWDRSRHVCTDSVNSPTMYKTTEEFERAREKLLMQVQTHLGSRHQRSLYNHTISWIKELTNLADGLIPVPILERNTALRERLQHIERMYFPSGVLYVPVGNSYHRVRRIVVEECRTFSTKERVPYFLCLEVVDYADHDSIHQCAERLRSKHRKELSMKLPIQGSTLTIAVEDEDDIDLDVPEPNISPLKTPTRVQREETETKITMFHKNISVTYRRDNVPSPKSELLSSVSISDRTTAEEEEAAAIETKPPPRVFGERWSRKEERLRQQSPDGHLPNWRLLPVIVKSNDDLRQEQFAAQLIAQFQLIFQEASLHLHLRPYDILATSPTCGLIEAVPDAISLDALKKRDGDYTTLFDFFTRYYGDPDSKRFQRARKNFVDSLAAYSIVCYLLQIKDRHNGNILLHADGYLIHIDFGFMLGNTPGKNINFERAPFKLTDEFVELMGGSRSATFISFRRRCVKAYMAARKQMTKIILLVEMMMTGNEELPCFAAGKDATIEGLRQRFNPDLSNAACHQIVNELIDQSLDNWRTRWYDKYQRCCLGIL